MPKVDFEYLIQHPLIETPADCIQSAMGLCTCGSDSVGELLREVLTWCAQEDRFEDKEGCYRSREWELAAKLLDSYELIEHGTGIGWPWITDDGRKVLEMFEALE